MKLKAAIILVVDDELANRRLMEALLTPEGYVVLCAASGEEALASIAQHAPDLILLDVMMPGMDGYAVATTLKASPVTSNIPIIMLTALIDKSARLAGLSAGAEEFLTKPIDRAELWLRVRNLLRLKSFGDFLLGHSWILEQQVRARTADLQRFRSAMDATAEAIFLVCRNTMLFVEVNATACTMLGYSRSELLQMGPSQVTLTPFGELADAYDALIAGDGPNELREIDIVRKDGSLFPVEIQRRAQLFETEWIIVGVLRDISERKQAEQRLQHMAHYDALTGLPNRVLFYETLKKTLTMAAESGWKAAILFVDLDHFKSINDTMGHAIGDELLVQVSERLVSCVRVRDTVGRLGGDEFALILTTQADQQSAGLVAAKIVEQFHQPFVVQDRELRISVSVGISVHPDDAIDPDTLIRFADTAMYRAKQGGRDTFCFFTAQMNIEVQARLALERDLRVAVEREEFILYYQPQVDLATGRIAGVEALLRWNRPGHGLVSPNVFIHVLEETGLIVRVGNWVIASACRQLELWQRAFFGPLRIAINVSGRQFIDGNLEETVIRSLSENGVAAELLEIELTESSLMENTERTIAALNRLKKLGVRISVDDFGTGYSSLAYLRRFPLDTLKIDIAFIREVTSNADDAAIACAIIGMAHQLRLNVVAEGVETAAQLEYLRRHHCDQIQGYYFSPALGVADVELLLHENRSLSLAANDGPGRIDTLLLVDDEAYVLSSLTRLLRTDGYQILTARSAAEGFELLALNDVQVIVCDQRMPEMSGTEFFDRVKDMYPATFRIVLSGYTDLESIMEAINLGSIYRFYTKPWDNALLRENVREAFRHHALVHRADIETVAALRSSGQ
jgi:diguanylate cyclase (GGDEF)-like protein/PAS domain S-box-containing protein